MRATLDQAEKKGHHCTARCHVVCNCSDLRPYPTVSERKLVVKSGAIVTVMAHRAKHMAMIVGLQFMFLQVRTSDRVLLFLADAKESSQQGWLFAL